MMNKLIALEAFRRVAETRSFTKAAKLLEVSSSSVSKSVARLESELGIRLLQRTTRVVSLTDDGAAYFEAIRRALTDLEQAEHVLARATLVPRGRLSVGLPLTVGRRAIIPHLPRFLARYPEIQLDVKLSDDFVNLVERGVDVVLRIGSGDDASLVARRIGSTRRVICGAPAYFEAHGIPASARDLERHRLLRFPGVAPPFDWVTIAGRDARIVAGRGTIRVDDGESLVALALSGVGLVALLDVVVEDELRSGRLRTVLDDLPAPRPTPIMVAYPASEHVSPKVRAFVDFVSELFPRTTGASRPSPREGASASAPETRESVGVPARKRGR
ncbi:Transcriptional regulator, LysR family protein [Minicystis rosea]|nr:Transcriptional regulator, LysR family protein [Minicystis rosea]